MYLVMILEFEYAFSEYNLYFNNIFKLNAWKLCILPSKYKKKRSGGLKILDCRIPRRGLFPEGTSLRRDRIKIESKYIKRISNLRFDMFCLLHSSQTTGSVQDLRLQEKFLYSDYLYLISYNQ